MYVHFFFTFSGNVIRLSVLYVRLLHSRGKTGEVPLTLRPPGTPPAHLAARPGWIPGPGSFHCGTAGGRSHRAAKAEDTVTTFTCTA